MTEETSLELERGIVAAMHPQLQEQERRKPKISTWNNCRGLASAETAFRVWPTTGKQLCTISHCTGNWPGLGHCEKFDTISWKEERDEISSQRNSLKTKREKHYLTALGLLLNWIKHHDLVTQRYLRAPLIPAQETDLSSGRARHLHPHCQEPVTIWSGLDYVAIQLFLPTHTVPEAAQVIDGKCCSEKLNTK